jgi:hypothetical protein
MEEARTGNKDLCVAFLDISDAFGSVSHAAVERSLLMAGAGQAFAGIVADLYDGTSTRVLTLAGLTDSIDICRGVKQGDPLSPILFDLAIDPLVRRIQSPSASEHQCTAYADDIAVLRDSPSELQEALDDTVDFAKRLGLRLNPEKSVTFHLSGRTPRGMRETQFTINGAAVRHLMDGDSFKFLGNPVGFNICPPTSTVEEFICKGQTILSSMLAPWQKLDALKTFFFPSLQFAMRMGTLPKGDWTRLDKELRGGLKATLNLPVRATNFYLYGSSDAGCCNIPLTAESSDIFLADGAFKLLTSKDPRIASLASRHLEGTVSGRLSRPVSKPDLERFLSGCQDDEFCETSAPARNVWTRARQASSRLSIRWTFSRTCASLPSVERAGSVVSPSQRFRFAATIRKSLRAERDAALNQLPDQGKAMTCVKMAKASHSFIRTGENVTFADWRFIHRARLNVLPLNGCRPRAPDRRDPRPSTCRRCGHPQETLPHVIQHCMRYSRLFTDRHDRLVARIKKAATGYRHVIMGENCELGVPGLRPDLVIRKGGIVTIIDVACPFPNRPESLDEAAREKVVKYEPLARHLRRAYPQVSVVPFIVGSLGVWYPDNDRLLNKICSKSYAHKMRNFCVSDVIKISRQIYLYHVKSDLSSALNLPEFFPAESFFPH